MKYAIVLRLPSQQADSVVSKKSFVAAAPSRAAGMADLVYQHLFGDGGRPIKGAPDERGLSAAIRIESMVTGCYAKAGRRRHGLPHVCRSSAKCEGHARFGARPAGE